MRIECRFQRKVLGMEEVKNRNILCHLGLCEGYVDILCFMKCQMRFRLLQYKLRGYEKQSG